MEDIAASLTPLLPQISDVEMGSSGLARGNGSGDCVAASCEGKNSVELLDSDGAEESIVTNPAFLAPAQAGPIDARVIQNVWQGNLSEEFCNIRKLRETYKYVAMDTEFPGIVAKPRGAQHDHFYHTLSCNVNMLKLIQLGLSFMDEHGNMPPGTNTWQFNFVFDVE